jgi:outer membrane protein assembly factor BamB
MPGWIDTDDTMLCLEAATGRTLWKTAFKERGLNFNGGAGPHMTPCFAEGRVFGVGSAGAIHALDAGTGAVLWESTVGPEAERAEQLRRDCHAKRLMPVVNLDFCGTPLCVDGVLACNDNAGGMVGLDAATGRRRWGPVTNCLRKTGSPVVWRHDGTNYLIAVWDRAVCVAPRTGQVVWEIAEGASSESTPAVSGDILVTGGGGKGQTGLTGFRMSPAGATRLWHADGKWNGHVTSPLIHNGHAYCFGGGGDAVCIEIATGQVAGTASFYSVRTCSSFVGMDGRVIRPHLYNKLLFYDANARNFRQLGDLWVAPSYAECTTPAVSDGRMFFRGKDCVYAYDLRRR